MALANSSSAARRSRAGLSRPEITFFLGLAVVTATLAITATLRLWQRQRQALARMDIEEVIAACRRFHREYGAWPTAQGGDEGDLRVGGPISNSWVLNVLRAVDGPGNEGHRVNKQRMVFLEAQPLRPGRPGLNEVGELLDPWGAQYQLVLDTDHDNVCEVRDSVYGRIIGEGMIMWSCGPDKTSDTPDDIRSWQIVRPQVIVPSPSP
jgi:hypothetical protein